MQSQIQWIIHSDACDHISDNTSLLFLLLNFLTSTLAYGTKFVYLGVSKVSLSLSLTLSLQVN